LESALSPKQAVRAFLGEIVERSLDDRDRRGCLLVNSALEIARLASMAAGGSSATASSTLIGETTSQETAMPSLRSSTG
jgi:hypothetical protein